MRNDYITAIHIYETLLQGGESAELYYNLGNSYYKTDNLAKAILNYERALLLQPGNPDIRANIEIARAKTIDKVTPIPEIFFVSWFNSLTACLAIDSWAWVGISFFILMLACACFFFLTKRVALKKVSFGVGILSLCITLMANLFASSQKDTLLHRDEAIIMQPSVTVRSTPSESGTELFILHEGHKVKIKDNVMQDWKEIAIEDGKIGWIPTAAIEII